MSRADVMMGYMPRYLLAVPEYRSVIERQGTEFQLLRDGTDNTLEQFFAATATWGLDQWEAFLGLKTIAGKPVDQRRSTVIAKLRGVGTVTLQMIKSVAEAYDSQATVIITEQAPLHLFRVELINTLVGASSNLNDLRAVIEAIRPAHLCFELATQVPVNQVPLPAAGRFVRVATTDLPEWRPDLRFGAQLAAPGGAAGIVTTGLPEWREDHHFDRHLQAVAGVTEVITTALPEWELVHRFGAGVVATAGTMGAMVTELPGWEVPYHFSGVAVPCGSLVSILETDLPEMEGGAA